MKTLKELFPHEEILTLKEALDKIGWKYTQIDEHHFDPVFCTCGTKIKYEFLFGRAWCDNCDIMLQDLTGLVPAGPNTVGLLDCEVPTDGRAWVIMKESDKK